VHSSDATRLISAKKYLEMDQIEKKKPFWMRMAVGALAGVGLSALASPIAGLAGLTWLTPLLWRAGTSVVAGAAIGGMVNNRLKKRNFKHAGIWGLAAGIVAGIGSFIGGQVVSDWINGTATGGNKGSREFSPFNEKQSYAPPTNLNRDNPSGIYNV
jgi:hypothetical protein